jgi:TPR repeat protein
MVAPGRGTGECRGAIPDGTNYQYGQGVKQDYTEAIKWFRKAADQGVAGAQWSLGEMYAKGDGVTKDYAEALKWWRKAADQGDPIAQHEVGSAYKTAGA